MTLLILTSEQISVSLETKEGELRLDSRIVCSGFGVKNHTDYRRDILEKYQSQFAELGVVLNPTLPTGEIVWYLSQAQVNFAGMLARNTERAVAFKLNLAKAFELAKQNQQAKLDREYPKQITGSIEANPTLELVANVSGMFDILFAAVEPEIRTGMKISAICNVDPTLRPILEPFKPKLLLEAPLLSPTDIGKLLEAQDGINRSGQAINKLLIDRNLQIATGDKKLAYRAIGQGIEFSKVVADTASGHGKTVQSLRWYESVVDLLA